MGTLSSVVAKVRLHIREEATEYFTDANFISMANDILNSFYDDMRGVNCKAIMSSASTTLSASVDTLAIASKDAIVVHGVYADKTNLVPRYSELYPDRFSYIETSSGITFYNQGTEAIIAYYWDARPTALTALADTLPWDGEWDDALRWTLILTCKMIRQYDISTAAIMANNVRERALARMIQKHGALTYSLAGSYVY
jgi:hypothetical protein